MKKPFFKFVALGFLLIVIVGCAIMEATPVPASPTPFPPATVTPSPIPPTTTPTSLPPTATSVPPTGTPTSLPPTAAPKAPTTTALPVDPNLPVVQPGEYQKIMGFGGLTREYILHIPPGYDGSRGVPLVIIMHGYSASHREIQGATGMNAKADQEGFVVVYPNGTGEERAWNAGFFPARAGMPDDVGFLNALINLLEKKLRLDSRRIYAGGFSNGAMMSYRLGAMLPNRIAAIAVVEGSNGTVQPDGSVQICPVPLAPVPVIAFNGKLDEAVPYDGGVGYRGYNFLSVADSIGFWVEHNGCENTPQITTSQNGNVVMTDYAQCKAGSEVLLYTIENGKHRWPITELPANISATDAIWEFFSRHPKP